MDISTNNPPVRLNPEEAIKLMEFSDVDKCQGCGCEVTGNSPCPFVEEIHNEESMCNCCDECRHECAQNI